MYPYNITEEILRAAKARPNLEPTATGGGCDYIVRFICDRKHVLVLGIVDDAGSPDTLEEPATVTLYLNETDGWQSPFLSFTFGSAVDAMDFMNLFDSASGFDGSPATVDRVANEFLAVLLEWLGPDVFRQVLLLNSLEPNPDVCHSHDFCDANEAMVAAFHRCELIAPYDLGMKDGTPEHERACKLWNAAWTAAFLNRVSNAAPPNVLLDDELAELRHGPAN